MPYLVAFRPGRPETGRPALFRATASTRGGILQMPRHP